MDALVELARSSPLDTLAQAQSFHAKLTDALAKSAKKLAGAVDKVLGELILSPAHGHGLACAELLHYKLQCSVPPNDPGKNPLEFIDQARSVLLGISARDALVAAKAVSNISRQMTKALLHTDRCMRGLGALKAIVQKISESSPSTLTCVHVDLMLVVLKCHAYDLVEDLTFLRPTESLLQVAPSVWPLESIDYLQFWYYLGMFHSAQQQFAAATDAFNLALTIPNNGAVSAVQVEAYKKMILVSLLASGESPVLNQRLSSPALLRYLETLTVPYQELAKAYRKGSSSLGGSSGGSSSTGAGAELAHLVEAHSGTFAHDKNLGLVKQLMRALEKKQVTRLTQTYLTFSLNDIAAHINLGPQQQQQKGAAAAAAAAAQQPAQLAERYVFDMICARDVYARLDGKARMVHFLEAPEEYDSASVIARMNGKIEEIMALNAALAEREKQLQLTPAYIMRTMQGRNGGGGGGATGNEAMDAAMARSLSLNEFETGRAGVGFGRAGPAFDEDDDLKAAVAASMMEQ